MTTTTAQMMVPSWKRRVHPRRGFPSAIGLKTKIDAKQAREVCRGHYLSMRPKLLDGAAQPFAAGAVLEEVDARWTNDAEPSDVRVEAAAGAIARFRLAFSKETQAEALVDHWVTTKGVAFATDATLASLAYGVGISATPWEQAAWFRLAAMDNEKNHAPFDAPGFVQHANDARPMLARLRRLLVEASDADHAAATKVALAHRQRTKDYVTRVAGSYLFPTERAWVEADIASFADERELPSSSERRTWWRSQCSLLVCSITRFADFLAMSRISDASKLPEDTFSLAVNPHTILSKEVADNYLATVLEGLGTELVPLVKYWCEHWTPHKETALALSVIPTDEAMSTLLDHAHEKSVLPALTEAIANHPEIAARLIGERVRTKGKNHKLVEPMKPLAGKIVDEPAKGSRQAAVPADRGATPAAAGDGVPDVLIHPPWLATPQAKPKAKKAGATIATVTRLAYPVTFAWIDGEKERFQTTEWDPKALEPGGYLDTLRKGKWAPAAPLDEWTVDDWRTMNTDWETRLTVIHGPEELSLEHVKEHATDPKYAYDLHTAIARYELRIAPLVLEQAARHPKDVLDQIGPYDAAELGPIVAGVLHVKKLKPAAEAWLFRHPRAAATGLIPNAVAGTKDEKKAAVAALQVMVNGGHESAVRDVAREYGPDVVAALGPLLGEDPRLSKKPPKAPAFFSRARLPAIQLRTGAPLPSEALDNLRVMLTWNELGRPFPGLADALAACDRSSLAAFGWALFEAWQRAGWPNEEKWAFVALGVLGDDDVARRLTPLVRKWPGESAHARATIGLEVLGAIGTDLALMSIHGIAERLKFPALKELAQKQIAAIAKRLQLSVPELEDRLVPDLDLDEDGSMSLEHDGARFKVGFDEHLVPFVRPNLPKAAKTASATFSALKKDVKALAALQLSRLERAMVDQRRWTTSDFDAFLVRHPLLIHLVRRLVWGTYGGDRLTDTFRVAEDQSLATIEDVVFTLTPGVRVGIVHPTDLDDARLAAWGKVFGEYELLQPFPQLGRGRHGAADAARVLRELVDLTVPTGKILGLASAGWSRGAPQDSGFVGVMERSSSIGTLSLELEQGFIAGAVSESPEQTLKGVFAGDRAVDEAALARLRVIEASELAYSLSMLTG